MSSMYRFLFGFLCAGLCQGQIVSDNFDVDGDLRSSAPNVGTPWVSASGIGRLEKADGAVLMQPGLYEEVDNLFAAVTNATVYAGLSITVPYAPNGSWMLPFCFRGDSLSGGDQIGRIFIDTGSSTNTFLLGIDNDKDNPVWWPVELNEQVTYKIVVGFTENDSNDITRLWVEPASMASSSIVETVESVTPAVYGVRLNAFNGSDGYMQLDDLVVSTNFAVALAGSLVNLPPPPLPPPPVPPSAPEIALLQSPTHIIPLVADSAPGYTYEVYFSNDLTLPEQEWTRHWHDQLGDGGFLAWFIPYTSISTAQRYFYIKASIQ